MFPEITFTFARNTASHGAPFGPAPVPGRNLWYIKTITVDCRQGASNAYPCDWNSLIEIFHSLGRLHKAVVGLRNRDNADRFMSDHPSVVAFHETTTKLRIGFWGEEERLWSRLKKTGGKVEIEKGENRHSHSIESYGAFKLESLQSLLC